MVRALIDTASLHSALDEVSQGHLGSLSKWHRNNLLEVTYLLLHHNMRVVPRILPLQITREAEDVSTFVRRLKEMSFPRARILRSNQELALSQAASWSDSNQKFIGTAWGQSQQNPDLQDWVYVQRERRMYRHTEIHGNLFEEEFIPYMTVPLGVEASELVKVHRIGADSKLVKTMLASKSDSDLDLLTQAWVLGGMLRGKYFEKLAALENLQLALHPFRKPLEEQLPNCAEQTVNRTEDVFVRLIVGRSLLAKRKYRVEQLAANISLARAAIFAKNKADRISLSSADGQVPSENQSVDMAIGAAKKIGLFAGSESMKRYVSVSLSTAVPSIVGYALSDWPAAALAASGVIDVGNWVLGLTEKGSLGTRGAHSMLTSNTAFKLLSRSVAGRIDTRITSRRK